MTTTVTCSLADQITDAAVAALIAAGTIAGDQVEAERVVNIAALDMPRIVVHYSEDLAGESNAGTAPRFKDTMTIIVQCLVGNAILTDCQKNLRALLAQAKDALLSNGGWVMMSEFIASMKVIRLYKHDGAMFLGDGRIELTLTWSETYTPDITDQLDSIQVTEQIGPVTTPPGGNPQIVSVITIPTS